MSDLARMLSVVFAKQSSATVFDAASIGTAFSLEPESCEVMPRDTVRLERNLVRGDNQEYASVIGPKALDPIAMTLLMRGVSGNTGTSAFASATTTEIGQLLDCIIAAAVDPSGAGSTATAGATPNLTMTSGANYANGDGVLFATSTGTWAREIVSGGGTSTLVLDRAYTGTVSNPTTILRGAHWLLTPATSMKTHGFIRAKGEHWERSYAGCMSSLDLDFSEGQVVKASMSWQPTDWTDTTVGTAFSAPTAGSHIVNIGATFMIGDTAFLLKGAKLTLGYTISPRTTVVGPNGIQGYVVTREQPVLTGSLYVGSNSSFGEINDSSGTPRINSLTQTTNDSGTAITAGTAAATYDISLQVGTAGSQAMYLRMPAAEFSGKVAQDNGVEVINFSAKATRPSSGSALRLFLY